MLKNLQMCVCVCKLGNFFLMKNIYYTCTKSNFCFSDIRFQYLLFIFFLPLLWKGQGVAFAQNLLPNPSFELYSQCPDNENQVEYATGWSNYSSSTPDYFNSCSQNPDFSIPDNWAGYHQDLTGKAYCGIGVYAYPSSVPNLREFIGRKLSTPLLIGGKYNVSFKVSLGINRWPKPDLNCATNNLGMLFSTIEYSINNPLSVQNYAHVFTDTIIKDTINWSVIKGSFIADSAYMYVIIGNFFDDLSTDTAKIYNKQFNQSFCVGYYLIDDVFIEKDIADNTNIISEKIINNFFIYPNPFNDFTNILFEDKGINEISLILYDVFGKNVKELHNLTSPIILQKDNISEGIYFMKIQIGNQFFVHKLLITN
jgi:hypothetical protein